jgi:hypothetical protein
MKMSPPSNRRKRGREGTDGVYSSAAENTRPVKVLKQTNDIDVAGQQQVENVSVADHHDPKMNANNS